MAIETTKENLSINKLVCEKKEMIFVEGDMIVPDSKPDILNTVNTSGTVCVYKKEMVEGKVKIDGNINTYIMYIADDANDNIRGLNTNLDFSQTINVDNCDENMILETEVNKKSIECKVLNGRKISIRVGLEINLKIYSNEEIQVINKIDGQDDIQVLEKSIQVNSQVGRGNTKENIKDTITIDNADELAEILQSDISLVDKEVKISYNKVLAKAEANIKIMYLTEDNEIKSIEKRIPVVGFIDIQNVSEENVCDVNYEIKNLILKPNSVDEHSIHIELEVEIICMAYENKKINLIEDMYSPCEDIKFDQRKIKTMSQKDNRLEVCKISNNIKVDELNSGRLIDVCVSPIINNKNKKESNINYEGKIGLKFIYVTNDSINSKIVNLPLEYTIDNINDAENMNVSEQIDIKSKDFIVQSGGNVDCNIELAIFLIKVQVVKARLDSGGHSFFGGKTENEALNALPADYNSSLRNPMQNYCFFRI